MKTRKPKKRSEAARALTSALFRQRKRPSKKLYRRRARTRNAGLRDQAGSLVWGVRLCREAMGSRVISHLYARQNGLLRSSMIS